MPSNCSKICDASLSHKTDMDAFRTMHV